MSGLLSKIEARETERRQLALRIGVLDVELALLRELKAEEDAEAGGRTKETDPRGPSAKRGTAGANMSDKWKCVLIASVKLHPASVRNDDVPEIQRSAGQSPANQEGIRSHVSTFKSQGLYEKTGIGAFRATQKAADLVGLRLGAGASESPQGEPGFGQPRLDINHQESVEAVDAARKAGGTC
jgi:hypothetical protein